MFMSARFDVDAVVARTASGQSGAFSLDQAHAAGADEELVARRVASGLWVPQGSDAFTMAAHADSLDQRRWVGLLAAGDGAHLSHQSAAELHRLDGIQRGLVVVTTRHGHHVRVPGGTLHQIDDVAPHHLIGVDGFPTTTAARTLLDLAPVTSYARLRIATQDLVVRRLSTFGELADVLRELRRRGKPGIRKTVKVLDSLDGKSPPETVLERMLLGVIERAGLVSVPQHPLPTHEPIRGLVDFALVESKLILEADGRLWHARLQAMANDRRRDREAARLGWLTLRFMYEDLLRDPVGEALSLRQTHDLRLAAA